MHGSGSRVLFVVSSNMESNVEQAPGADGKTYGNIINAKDELQQPKAGDGDGDEALDAGQLSPLTGSYLLIVIAEPYSEQDKERIIQRLTKGTLYIEEFEL